MRAINYKMKWLNMFAYSSKENHETWNYPEYILRLQNNVKMTQIKN